MSIALLRRMTWPGKHSWVAIGLALMLLAACNPARAQGPVAGRAYQIPGGYQGNTPGTIISYGGYSYVIQTNGTMLLVQQPAATTNSQAPVAGTAYQIPPGYEAYAPGSTISYGGYSYVVQSDGTMLLVQQPGYTSYYVPPSYNPYYGPLYGRRPVPRYRPGRGQWTTGMFGQPIRVPSGWQSTGGNSFYDPRTGRRIMVD